MGIPYPQSATRHQSASASTMLDASMQTSNDQTVPKAPSVMLQRFLEDRSRAVIPFSERAFASTQQSAITSTTVPVDTTFKL
jgi:hypothetical protein